MSNRAPVVPAGAPFGASSSYDGMAMRVVRVLDSDDPGHPGGRLVDGLERHRRPRLLRRERPFVPTDADAGAAVAIANTSAAGDDIDTSTAHGFVAGDRVVFTALTGGAGLKTNTEYYVIAANLAANTFQVSTTPAAPQ
jgi:hypothetical protein